jgi:hypothetical protein
MPIAGALAAPLANRGYRRLFLAQLSALLGAGADEGCLALCLSASGRGHRRHLTSFGRSQPGYRPSLTLAG